MKSNDLIGFFCLVCVSPVMASPGESPALVTDVKGVWRADFSQDSGRVITQTRRGRIGLWDAATGRAVLSDLHGLDGEYAINASADRVLVKLRAGGCRVFEFSWGRGVSPSISFDFMDAGSTSFGTFSPDGSVVLLHGKAGSRRAVRTGDGRTVAEFTLPETADGEISTPPVFSADGRMVFILDGSAVLHRYGTTDWQEVLPSLRHPRESVDYSFGFAVSADATHATTFSGPGENGPDGRLQLWDLKSGNPIGAPVVGRNGMTGRFLDVPKSAGLRLLLSPGRGRARVVRVPSMAEIYDLRRHDDVECGFAALTDDGQGLYAWGYDGMISLTDGVSGELQGLFRPGIPVESVIPGPRSGKAWVKLSRSVSFGGRFYWDSYVVRLSAQNGIPEAAASLRVTESLARVSLSPDRTRMMLIMGRTDAEFLRFYDPETLEDMPIPPKQ